MKTIASSRKILKDLLQKTTSRMVTQNMPQRSDSRRTITRNTNAEVYEVISMKGEPANIAYNELGLILLRTIQKTRLIHPQKLGIFNTTCTVWNQYTS